MTGVRGVGKTSTARLIAKALNCVGPDGQGGPTIDPCGECEPCRAIAEGRHIDVIEMDAASHTGVDDVREIIEAVRYAAVSARYKLYILDEVHMLSRNAKSEEHTSALQSLMRISSAVFCSTKKNTKAL